MSEVTKCFLPQPNHNYRISHPCKVYCCLNCRTTIPFEQYGNKCPACGLVHRVGEFPFGEHMTFYDNHYGISFTEGWMTGGMKKSGIGVDYKSDPAGWMAMWVLTREQSKEVRDFLNKCIAMWEVEEQGKPKVV